MATKAAKFEGSIWYSEKSRRIHIAGGGFRSTVNADPESKRYHPNLFKKLARVLEEQGKPGPGVDYPDTKSGAEDNSPAT